MSFSFDTPASSADVTYALGRQGSKGAAASSVYDVIHTGGSEGPGLLIDQGELEVGAGYYTGTRVRKVGARPNFDAAGRSYLKALGHMLQGAGLVHTGDTGDGASSPVVGHFQPATAASQVPYYTFVADYGAVGPKVQQLDSRLAAVEINIVPGQPVQARMAGLGRTHSISTLNPVADANPLEPSVVADVLPANAVVFGQQDVCFRAIDLLITQVLFSDNQCVGSDLPSDIVPTGLLLAVSGVLACNNNIYRALAYGGAALTTTGATFQGGAFGIRLNTDGNAGPNPPYNVPGYLQATMSQGRYWLPANVAAAPGRDVVCPFTAVCTGTFQIDLMIGSNFTYLN